MSYDLILQKLFYHCDLFWHIACESIQTKYIKIQLPLKDLSGKKKYIYVFLIGKKVIFL